MSRNTRSKFSQKILKNIEKTYHSTTDKEDIYRTFAPNVNNNRNRKMSNIPTTNNNNSHKTAEPALTSLSQTSSSVEQVPGNNSLITRDSTPHLPNAPIVETVDEMEIEVTNNNETQQLSEGSTSINGNPPPMEEIPMIDNIFSASNTQTQTSFEGFIPRDSFPPKLTDKEILQKLNTIFIGDKEFIKVRSLKKMTFKFYMISVSTKEKLSHLIKTSPPTLPNVKIYEYTQHNIDTLIERKLQLQDDTIIKILDIPVNYDVTLLIKQITDATGKRITTYKETKKPPQRIQNRNKNDKPIFIKPIYKQLIISFEDKAAADYLLEQDWCLAIEDSVARILPGNPKHPIYTQRTSAFYKITGLPLNTNAKDLSPLVEHLKGRTCTFTQTSRSSFFKNAFIYVHPNDVKKDYTTITGTKFGQHTIFIFPYTNIKKTCNACGNHTHEYKNCTSTDFTLDKNERKIFKRRFITRNKERILINETTRQNYNHVIRLSKDNPGNSTVQSRPQPTTRGKQKQTYNNTPSHPDRTHQKSTSSWSQQQLPQEILDKIAHMEQQITTLTNHVNVLQGSHQTFTEQYSSHHQQLTTIDTNIALLTHRQDSLENQHKTLMTQMQTLINTLQASQTPSPRQQPARKAKRTSTPYEKTPLKDVKKRFIQPSSESVMTDSDALPLSDEYYTESGDVSDTGTIENTYEAAEQEISGQSSFILNPFNWGNKPQV
ncbi:hypothetical protein RhiirA1_394790 [Rhizophagus irregularis]|uniref:CCHC-type domain-containing protein n=2 Tax=Rhizophagus irregularis TaxID=588596 RepID=A0A2N0RRV3_9GLOM|nr:hypothetical protein RhiirA1_466904 [Rhizophagus irregularis]PKC66040.1 hypothetical protein RhiirA1_394790 [Rhizophagus irregularis]